MDICSCCIRRSHRHLERLERGEISVFSLPFEVKVWILFGALWGARGSGAGE
jgi:hypothetical protein